MLFSDPTGSGLEGAAAGARAGHGRRRRPRPRRQPRALQARVGREAAGHRRARCRRRCSSACSAGTSRASTSTCARSASTSGRTATRRASRSCSTRTWRRCARATTRSRDAEHAATQRRQGRAWDERMDELGARYPEAVVTLVAPTASRSRCACPWRWTARRSASGSAARRSACPGSPGWPASPRTTTRPTSRGSATSRCAATSSRRTAPGRSSRASWSGGFELPPGSVVARARLNMSKIAPLPQDRQARAGRARDVAPQMQIAPAEAGAIRETRTSRLRCALVSRSRRAARRASQPLASLFALRPRLEDQ